MQLINSSRFLGLALSLLCLLFLAPSLGKFSGLLDEGLVLAPALRIFQGELPYRDVYLFTTPFGPLLFALFFKAFGVSLYGAQWLECLLRSSCVVMLYVIGLPLLGPRKSLIPAVFFLFLYGGETNHYLNHWVANFSFLVSLLAIQACIRKDNRTGYVVAGLGVGLSICSLQTFGVASLLAGVWALTLHRRWRFFPYCALGVILALLPLGLWLASQNLLGQFYIDTVGSNLYRSSFESVSLRGFLWSLGLLLSGNGGWAEQVSAVLLLACHALGLLGPLWLLRKDRSQVELAWLTGVAWLMGGVCCYRLLPTQLLLHGMLCIVLMVVVIERCVPRPAYLLGFLFLPFGAVGLKFYEASAMARHGVDFPIGQVAVSTPQEAESLAQLSRFLQKSMRGSNTIFFTPYVPNLYFLMNVKNPTRYCQMRALQYSPAQMAEALAALGSSRVVRFPVYDSDSFLAVSWPDLNPERYHSQMRPFYEALAKTHDMRDFGALQLYSPRR